MGSNEAVGQGHFRVTKCKGAYLHSLELALFYRFSFFCNNMGKEGDHILSHSLLTICKTKIEWKMNKSQTLGRGYVSSFE